MPSTSMKLPRATLIASSNAFSNSIIDIYRGTMVLNQCRTTLAMAVNAVSLAKSITTLSLNPSSAPQLT